VVIAATHVKELNAVELSENQIRFGASVTLNRTDQTLCQAIDQLHGLCDTLRDVSVRLRTNHCVKYMQIFNDLFVPFYCSLLLILLLLLLLQQQKC